MFKNSTPLSATHHLGLRLSSVFNYDHAQAETSIPIGLAEAGNVSREYAIVFSDVSEGQGALPLALTGTVRGQNAYLDPQGQWRARHVPAHVRRYPFIAGQAGTGTSRKMVLMFDADAPHFSGSQGLPLFKDDGEPSALVPRIESVLQSLQRDFERARAAVKALDDAGLLEHQTLRIAPRSSEPLELAGYRVLDLKKFGGLDAVTLMRLRDCGALMLAHAHLFSLSNLRDGVLSQPGSTARAEQSALAPSEFSVGLPEDADLSFEGVDWTKLGKQ